MLTRLKKLFRFWRQSDEFALTPQESVVFTLMLRTLSNRGEGNMRVDVAHTRLWDAIMCDKLRPDDLAESNLQDVMKSLASKLLKQQDYD